MTLLKVLKGVSSNPARSCLMQELNGLLPNNREGIIPVCFALTGAHTLKKRPVNACA